jgi:hypothetical protein
MRAVMFDSFVRTAAPVRARGEAKPKPQTRSAFARVRGPLLFALGAIGASAAIVGFRILFWALGHPDQPFFREIGKLWS